MLCLVCAIPTSFFAGEALAERYSGHLGRPLDAMKEAALHPQKTAALRFAMHQTERPGMLALHFSFRSL